MMQMMAELNVILTSMGVSLRQTAQVMLIATSQHPSGLNLANLE